MLKNEETLPEFEVQLNPAQYEAFVSEAREVFLLGGLGLGKSFFLALKLYQCLIGVRGSVFLLCSPSNTHLSTVTWPSVRSVWNAFGFLEGHHYVVNRKPPASWGVKPLSDITSNKVITTRFGTYCVLRGLENFDFVRGIELDSIFADEWRDVNPEARSVLLGRLRGKAYRNAGLKTRIYYATTPPEDVTHLLELKQSGDKEIAFIHGGSNLNAANLPANYVSELKRTYDKITYRREVLGELVSNVPNQFAYSFDSAKHVRPIDIDWGAPVHLSFDFNVNPATCIVAQHDYDSIRIISEIRLENATIWDVCEYILSAYGDLPFIVTGDATGRARQASQKNLRSYYQIIAQELQISESAILVPTTNPAHSASRMLTNSLLANHPDLAISPNCRNLIRDLETVGMDKSGQHIDKTDTSKGHLLDCLRYYFNTHHKAFISDIRNRRAINQ